jgi:hypothetical protein
MLSTRQLYRSNNQPANYAALTQPSSHQSQRRKEEALVRIGPEIGENGFRLRQIGWQEEAHPAERCVDIGGVRGLPLR